jgi:glycosyltransferase involved in cell wall biosynthesis
MKPSVFCFVTPFSSPASVTHAEKLLHCITPISEKVLFVGDQRVTEKQSWINIDKIALPTLHYLNSIQPRVYSYFIWIIKLIWILLKSSWHLLLNSRKVDIVICFLGLYYTPLLFIARILNKKAIAFEPASDIVNLKSVYGSRPWWYFLKHSSLLLRWLNRKFAHFIVVESLSVIDQGDLQKNKVKVRVANLYVDTGKFYESIPYQDRDKQIGYIGRLSKEKGILEFLSAAMQLTNKDFKFTVVGDGPLRTEVENKLKGLNASDIRLFSWLDYQEVPAFLNQLSLLVLPSSGEGVPNVVLEAMACGTPVLATPVGGIPDLIKDKTTGFILSNREPKTIASTLLDIMNHNGLEQISKQSRSFIHSNFSLTASTKKWEMIFNEIL